MKKIPKPKSVDVYIAAAPKEVQSKLKELRAAIREAAPTNVSKYPECATWRLGLSPIFSQLRAYYRIHDPPGHL